MGVSRSLYVISARVKRERNLQIEESELTRITSEFIDEAAG